MEKKVVEMYLDGKSPYYIEKNLGITRGNVLRILREKSIPMRTKKNNEEVNRKITQLYVDGYSTVKIAETLGFTESKVVWALQTQGVKLRSNKINSRRYDCDHDFFERVDTEEKAYWLGFMYADGYVTSDNKVGVSLSIHDKEHLGKFKNCLSATYPINEYISYPEFNNGVVTVEYARLLMTSEKMKSDLINLGCVEHKSLILKYPSREQVPHSLIPHFLRGYIDGDGSYAKSGNTHRIKICGTKEFLEGILQELQYRSTILKDNRHLDKNIYSLEIGGKGRLEDTINFLYEDATVFLSRKYEIIKQYLCNDTNSPTI